MSRPRRRQLALVLCLVLTFAAGFFAYPGARGLRRLATPPAAARVDPFGHRHQALAERAAAGGPACRVLFVGDSITDFWDDQLAWHAELVPRGAVNFGLASETARGAIRRLGTVGLENLSPEVLVLMIGTNDLGMEGAAPAEVAGRVRELVGLLRGRLPRSTIILMGVLPRRDAPELNRAIRACNAVLATTPGVTFIDLAHRFGWPPGPTLMPDGVHLSPDGYRIWLEALMPHL